MRRSTVYVEGFDGLLIREDKPQVNYKMIEHIDDILEILRNTKKPEEGEEAPITYLVQKDNDRESI